MKLAKALFFAVPLLLLAALGIALAGVALVAGAGSDGLRWLFNKMWKEY